MKHPWPTLAKCWLNTTVSPSNLNHLSNQNDSVVAQTSDPPRMSDWNGVNSGYGGKRKLFAVRVIGSRCEGLKGGESRALAVGLKLMVRKQSNAVVLGMPAK